MITISQRTRISTFRRRRINSMLHRPRINVNGQQAQSVSRIMKIRNRNRIILTRFSNLITRIRIMTLKLTVFLLTSRRRKFQIHNMARTPNAMSHLRRHSTALRKSSLKLNRFTTSMYTGTLRKLSRRQRTQVARLTHMNLTSNHTRFIKHRPNNLSIQSPLRTSRTVKPRQSHLIMILNNMRLSIRIVAKASRMFSTKRRPVFT